MTAKVICGACGRTKSKCFNLGARSPPAIAAILNPRMTSRLSGANTGRACHGVKASNPASSAKTSTTKNRINTNPAQV